MSDLVPKAGSVYNHFFVSGLNDLIRKDDTYKLRFTNEHALRDEPNTTNLKNRHTEWVLLRKEQKSKIPRRLWEALIDSVCGQTVSGSTIPSIEKIDYDRRHNSLTRYGLGKGQIFMDRELAATSVLHTIRNTTLTYGLTVNGKYTLFSDEIKYDGFNINEIDSYLSTPSSSRKFMNDIWDKAKPAQINEIFFDALILALDKNKEMNDIFKTSWISLHSIKLFNAFNNTDVSS